MTPGSTSWKPRKHSLLPLPDDPFWPRRVVVPIPGAHVPFHLMLAWHGQFFLDGLPPFTDLAP